MCGVCLCVVIPFILDVRFFVDVPARVTREEDRTGFLHLPSAVLALISLARRIQPFIYLVDREVELCVLANLIVLHLLGTLFICLCIYFCGKNPSSCDHTEIRIHVPTSEGFEVTN